MTVVDHHDFDADGGVVLHERSPLNPKSIYATSKVAADFLTMNYHDAYGVPAVVTRMFNNYGPRQNPRYVTGTIITQALERDSGRARTISSRCATSATAPTAFAATSRPVTAMPGRRLLLRPGREHLDARMGRPDPRMGEEQAMASDRELVTVAERFRPGASDVLALEVGFEKLSAGDRLAAARGRGRTAPGDDRVVRRQPGAMARTSRLGAPSPPPTPADESLVTGGRVSRLATSSSGSRRDGDEVVVPRIADYDLVARGRTAASSTRRGPRSCSTSPRGRRHRRQPRRTPAASATRTSSWARTDRAGPAGPASKVRPRGDGLRLPEAHARPRSGRRTCGTATRRRRTRPTASPRRRCSSGARPTGSSTA